MAKIVSRSRDPKYDLVVLSQTEYEHRKKCEYSTSQYVHVDIVMWVENVYHNLRVHAATAQFGISHGASQFHKTIIVFV